MNVLLKELPFECAEEVFIHQSHTNTLHNLSWISIMVLHSAGSARLIWKQKYCILFSHSSLHRACKPTNHRVLLSHPKEDDSSSRKRVGSPKRQVATQHLRASLQRVEILTSVWKTRSSAVSSTDINISLLSSSDMVIVVSLR